MNLYKLPEISIQMQNYFRTENENITALLIQNGADVNVEDEHQQTPLHLTAKRGNYSIVNCKNGYHQLHNPTGNKKIADLLIKNGADVNHMDAKARTPLHWASSFGKFFFQIIN